MAQIPGTSTIGATDVVAVVSPPDHSILSQECYVMYGTVGEQQDVWSTLTGAHHQAPSLNVYKVTHVVKSAFGSCVAPGGEMAAPRPASPSTPAPASTPAAGSSSSSKPATTTAPATSPTNTAQPQPPAQPVAAQPTAAPQPALTAAPKTAPAPAANAAAAPGAINPASYGSSPGHYASNGTPEYGQYGSGNWQVAGLVNIGEPTLRIVYDQSVPGAYQAAMATVSEFQADFPTLPQPGVTTGLHEVGYSAHYDGVQVQAYSDSPALAGTASTALEKAGISLIPMKTA
jgi:hypothetical protein